MAAAETARLIAELSLKDKMSAGIKSATTSIDKLDKRLGRIGKIAGRGLEKAAHNVERLGLVAGGVAVAGIAASVKAAGDFEASLNTINTVAQATPVALEAIGEGIRKLSRDTGTSVDDLGAAYYDLVSAGIKTADAQNVLTQANKLAIGGLSTTAEAVDLLTTAINSYGGDATKAATYTNMFAEAIAAGKTTASELAGSFAMVGPLAAKAGIGIDELAAAVGVMTATGTGTSEAFTQIRSAIVALQKPTATLNAIQKTTGINFDKLARKKGLAYAYTVLEKAAKKAGVPMAKVTGRIEGSLFAAQVAGKNFAKYSDELDRVRDSSEGAGVAQKQMDERTQGFNFAMQKLKANVHDAGITIGSELLPQLADLASEATTFLQGHQPELRAFAKDLAGGFRDAAKWAQSLDWAAITSTLRAGAGFGKALVEAFVNAPPWVQSFLAGGFVANKFTGGAVGGIIAELGKGLIKGVLGMNAGVVNINAGVVNGGGGIPGAPGSPKGGSALGNIAKTVGAVAVPVAIVAAESQFINAFGEAINPPGSKPSDITKAIVAGTLSYNGRVFQHQAGAGPKPGPNIINKINLAAETRDAIANPAKQTTKKVGELDYSIGIVRDKVQDAGLSAVAASNSAKQGIVGAVGAMGGVVAGAVRASRPIVTTTVSVSVSAGTVQKATTVGTRYGPPNGSHGQQHREGSGQ